MFKILGHLPVVIRGTTLKHEYPLAKVAVQWLVLCSLARGPGFNPGLGWEILWVWTCCISITCRDNDNTEHYHLIWDISWRASEQEEISLCRLKVPLPRQNCSLVVHPAKPAGNGSNTSNCSNGRNKEKERMKERKNEWKKERKHYVFTDSKKYCLTSNVYYCTYRICSFLLEIWFFSSIFRTSVRRTVIR